MNEIRPQDAAFRFLQSMTYPQTDNSIEIKHDYRGVPTQIVFQNGDTFHLADTDTDPNLTLFHFWGLQQLEDPRLRLSPQQKTELSAVINLLADTIWNEREAEMPALFKSMFFSGTNNILGDAGMNEKSYGILAPKDQYKIPGFSVTASTSVNALKAIIREIELLQKYGDGRNDLYGHDLAAVYLPSKRSTPTIWRPGKEIPENIILNAIGLEKFGDNYKTWLSLDRGIPVINIQANNLLEHLIAVQQVHKMLQEQGDGQTIMGFPFQVSYENSRPDYEFWQSDMNVPETIGEDILKAFLKQHTGIDFHNSDTNGNHPISFNYACDGIGLSVMIEDVEKVQKTLEKFQKTYPMIFGQVYFDVVGVP